MARKIAGALAYAWEKGWILHRDIKPANIMGDSDGEVKLMDLGTSKSMAESSARLTADERSQRALNTCAAYLNRYRTTTNNQPESGNLAAPCQN